MNIELNKSKKKIEEKELNIKSVNSQLLQKDNENKEGGSNSDSWGRINSNIDLKDSEYKGSKDVQRMS